MKSAPKSFFWIHLVIISVVFAACSGLPKSTTGGGTGTGLVLLDNNTDKLTITGNGTFPFATTIAKNGTYAVTVQTQPSNPTQTCAVNPSTGSGTVTANVTVTVTCGGTGGGSGPFTIGGTVIGLAGTGLVLQDNGADDLAIAASGAFTFKTSIASNGLYAVTVKTQPSSPTQNCSVSSGNGTATANVTNVQVTCGTVTTIGGTVSGLVGSGLVLQDNAKDNLTITGTGNVNFTFATPLSSGTSYAVTILTQPSNPGQTCSVVNGTGTATATVNTVQVVCPQPAFSIGGTLIGLVNGPGDTVELLNNGGDNIFVTGNNTTFTFPTQITSGGAYNVSLFAGPTSQPQPCVLFFYKGVATHDISSVVVDCQHNDWTWMAGPDTSGNYGTATLPPPTPPAQNTSNPGGREHASTWTDSSGRKWLFGGFGLVLTGASPPILPGIMNDLWLYSDFQGAWIPAGLPVTTTVSGTVTTAKADLLSIQTTGSFGGGIPGARWGSVTWSDSSGNLWLFGGQGISTTGGVGLLNDIWEFTPGSYDVSVPPNYVGSYTFTGNWTPVSGTTNVDQGGTYGTLSTPGGTPGGRWGAASCTDSSGNVWVFGGQGFDSNGINLGLLNDLWKYNIATAQWTWMGPTNSNVSQNNGVYGTQGTALAANALGPGGRQTAVLWADTSGNIWLFGGLGLDSAGTRNPGSLNGLSNGTTTPDGALLNDLWKFNIATAQWTWVSGGNVANQNGVYGTQQTAAASNVPGSRWSAGGWTDASGNLWFFGGWGYGSSLAQSTGFLNDVWEYQRSTGQWISWKGSIDVNQPGNYPTQFSPPYDVPFVDNTPGSRRGMAFWQPDGLDYFWVFGGAGFDNASKPDYLNDFWRYLPYP